MNFVKDIACGKNVKDHFKSALVNGDGNGRRYFNYRDKRLFLIHKDGKRAQELFEMIDSYGLFWENKLNETSRMMLSFVVLKPAPYMDSCAFGR
ncbi:MAG: hypothetical protein ACLUOI_37615 [Eisenbergiella sp.]